MLEPVVFIPRQKTVNLSRIWVVIITISIFLFLVALIFTSSLKIGLLLNIIFLPSLLTSKYQLKVVISPKDKSFKYYYLNSWGKEGIDIVNISSAEGSYKYIKLNSSKYGWQLIVFNNKRNKIKISQGTFKKFQLDQMVRMINQIKKGIFVTDVGTEF